jgi:glutamine---fructose-6-phosphate transaminase (isomerizing)
MCGIFGMVVSPELHIRRSLTEKTMDSLFLLSESRGKEASGIALTTADTIYLAKYALPASKLIHRPEYRSVYNLAYADKVGENEKQNFPLCLIGHSRLVTNGGQQIHSNNQPVISNGMVAIHNGIITNVEDLWLQNKDLERKSQVDTEILLSLMRKYFKKSGDLQLAVKSVYHQIEGVASTVVLFEDLDQILLATNNGSLYICNDHQNKTFIFASEKYILKNLIKEKELSSFLGEPNIRHIEPGSAILINLRTLSLDEFPLALEDQIYKDSVISLPIPRKIIDISPLDEVETKVNHISGEGPYFLPNSFIDTFPKIEESVAKLRRCTKCILPETMPFIEFDDNGVCNYCRNDEPDTTLGLDALMEKMAPYRKENGEPDCLVTFSGGRDSSYGLHFVKTVLEMNPITYTYDWGMVTDLARRNQMRMCGKLGVEHILVSADLAKKRSNIRKNVLAWLIKPDLGTIPLFMAGDKQYFYYANKVGEQTGCKIVILCENPLETTRFKLGFCGVQPIFSSSQSFNIPLSNRYKLARYYASQYLRNPAYLNSSLIDTLGAYLSYYFIPHNYINVYKYIQWDEKTINDTLLGKYNWETATDTKSTWRIGDGTASFYNYIYYTMSGLTENDTFRSNQIRAGIITRNQAMEFISTENLPRYESIQWYCDIIGIDFEDTIKTINSAPKLYSLI